jgi:hypothetical protein
MTNLTIDIQLLMNDGDADFLDAEHIKRFYLLLSENYNGLFNSPLYVDSDKVVELYYLYLVSSFVEIHFLSNKSIDDLMNLINYSKNLICEDPNDYVMAKIANELYHDTNIRTQNEDLFDDDFCKILMNISLLDVDFSQSVSKMFNLLSVVKESFDQGLFNSSISFYSFNDLSR